MDQTVIFNFEGATEEEILQFSVRNTARAVIFDKDNNIALMWVSKRKLHKLPGGGIDDGETVEEALIRECREEAGVNVTVLTKLGTVKEIKKGDNKVQNSYCYIAQVFGEKSSPQLTESEKEQGFEVLWLPLEEAIKLILNDGHINLAGRFVSERELAILNRAKEIVPTLNLY